jgi:hypothetical protein
MNIIRYLKDNKYEGMTDHVEISSDFYKKGITVSYETMHDENGEPRAKRRYIFTNPRRNRKLAVDNICIEANGLILEAPDWKPLVVSTYMPKTNVDKQIANSYLKDKKYDIFEIEDGTIINLYYYDLSDTWVISSARGIEVNDCIFNNLTYTEILNECLVKMGMDPQEFYDNLDKTINYTIGFKHPDMHPFQAGTRTMIYKLWFVQMTVINEEEQTIMVVKQSPWEKIPNHTRINFNAYSLGALFSKLKTAYDNFANDNTVNYGYLLVAKDMEDFADNESYSVILLESSLMNIIRNLWYDFSYTKFLKNKNFHRINTILLNSFPQYKSELDNLSAIETKLVNNILSTLMSEEPAKEVDTIVDVFCTQVKNVLTVGSHERPKQKIRNIIHNSRNIEYFYALSAKEHDEDEVINDVINVAIDQAVNDAMAEIDA